MKNRSRLLIVPLLLFVPQICIAQETSSIKDKYGPPTSAYSVSETIWMTPEFGPNGAACMMRLYPKRISTTTNYLNSTLNYWELKKVLNQLAPLAERGNPGLIFGLINLGGGRSETTYTYENIAFRFLKSESPYMDPIDKKKPAKTPPKARSNHTVDQEMIVPRGAEIVTIVWLQRPCVKN